MSFSATPERPTPHAQAYPLESRRQTMRDVISLIASKGALKLENAPAIAVTYGLTTIEIEAEMMKHLQEGGDK